MSPIVYGDQRTAAFAVLLAAMLFATTGTAQALGPDETTPLGVGGLRIIIGAVALGVVAMATRRSTSTPWPSVGGRVRWWFLVGGVGVAGYQPAFFTGTERTGVALGTIVALGSGPLFAGTLEVVWFRRRPPGSWVRATVLALAGGTLLVAAQGGDVRLDAVGLACAVAAGASYAIYAVAAKVLIERGIDSTRALAVSFAIGAVLLAPLTFTQPLGWAVTRDGVVMLAQLGIVTVGLAYWLYGIGLRHLPTSTAVTLNLAEPVTAALLGVIVLDERLTAIGWIGAGLVMAGLVLAGRPRSVAGITPEL